MEVVVPTSLPNLVGGQEVQNCLIQKVHFLALEEVLLAEVDRNSKVACSTMILNFLMLGMLDHYYLNYLNFQLLVVEAGEDHLKIHPNWRKVVELQIHFLKNPSVQAVEAFQVVHAMVQKMY